MRLTIFKDARYFQILFQFIFLCYGVFYLHWTADYWLFATYFLTAIATQLLCELIIKPAGKNFTDAEFLQPFRAGLPSVIISSFGLMLLLKTNHISVAIFASAVSIASKYLIRFRDKHIFNPSAAGIVAAIFITGNAWISPGQWGSGTVILFAAVCLGSIVVTRVQQLDVSVAFLATFAGLVYIRQVIFLGWPLDFFVQSLSSGSLLLFSFFMITDPKTTPGHTVARIGWSIVIAAIAFYLSVFKFMNGAPILVLVCMQPLVPVLDYFFKAKVFEWNRSFKIQNNAEYPKQKLLTAHLQ